MFLGFLWVFMPETWIHPTSSSHDKKHMSIAPEINSIHLRLTKSTPREPHLHLQLDNSSSILFQLTPTRYKYRHFLPLFYNEAPGIEVENPILPTFQEPIRGLMLLPIVR